MAEQLNLLNKIVLHFKSKDKKDREKYFQLEQKLISLSLDFHSEVAAPASLDFDLEARINEFVQSINLKILETYNQSSNHSDCELRLFAGCVDLLHNPKMDRFYEKSPEKLEGLRILAFNNLSCIHRKRQNFAMALKAVSHALRLEKRQLESNPEKIETVKNIISTYLNQAVISSELRKHENAVKLISTAMTHLEQLEKLLNEKEKSEDFEENNQGLLYLKMVSLFNFAVENEYLGNFAKAVTYYQETGKLAQEMKNAEIQKKCETALSKLNKREKALN